MARPFVLLPLFVNAGDDVDVTDTAEEVLLRRARLGADGRLLLAFSSLVSSSCSSGDEEEAGRVGVRRAATVAAAMSFALDVR